jgi:serine/threonine protein kinase
MTEFAQRPLVLGRFAVGPVMGTGMQATVRRGKDAHTDSDVALRIVNRRELTPSKLSKMEREINIMKIVNHPNVIGLKYVEMDMEWPSSDGPAKRVALMVLEIADNGELFDFLMHSGPFSDSIARAYMRQLLSALAACHSNLIFHRDIKPENILIDSKFQLKLADFGLSTIQESEDSLLQTDCGTRSYMSPEVVGSTQYRGEDADIWSAAVVMFIMLCGNPPFQVAAKSDWWFNAISLNRHDRFWAAHLRSAPHMATNLPAQSFLNKVFVKNPDERYKLSDMLADAWMTSGTEYTPEQLTAEMSHKKLAVIQGKEREAREAANRARRSGTSEGQFDPFAATTTYRSVNVGGSSVLEVSSDKIPASAVGKLLQTSFFSALPAPLLVAELVSGLRGIDSDTELVALEEGLGISVSLNVNQQPLEFEGEIIPMPTLAVKFDVRITVVTNSSTQGKPVYAVELSRTSGDLFSFQQVFRQIKVFIETFESTNISGKSASVSSDVEPALTEGMGII